MAHWTRDDIPSLHGRVAIVTGGNAGLGLEVARTLARSGARVVLAVRSTERGEQAAAAIRRGHPAAAVEVRRLDLSDLREVEAFAADWTEPLDLLIANAGLMAIDEARTAQGFEMQYGVNHLGHFALFGRLLPRMLAAPAGRIALMSSLGHRGARGAADPRLERSYDRWQAYYQSKLANLQTALEAHRRLEARAATAIAVAAHPGGTATDLGTEGTSRSNALIRRVVPLVLQSVERGAEPMLRAITDPDARGGEYYGPRLLRLRGRAVLETPSAAALDTDAARRLWDGSIELTGVDPGI
ncbi:MAG: hypothetical protein RI885_2085 [Actinomycetota bacterium]|jgi:NAD(P)-dependent dehydrogenase (short-subunit alcohol dehydrogenase family)